MKAFDFPPTGVKMFDLLAQRLRDVFASLAKTVTNDHVVGPVTIGTTPVQVFHGLGGPPLAWEVVGRDAGETVFESATANDRRRFLYLEATGTVSVTLRFS